MWISRARTKKCEHTATTYRHKLRPQTCAIRSRMPYCLFFKILIHTWCFEQNTQLVIRGWINWRLQLCSWHRNSFAFSLMRFIELKKRKKRDRSRFEWQTLISLDRLCLKSSSSSIIFRNCWRELEPSIWQQARQADNKVERHSSDVYARRRNGYLRASLIKFHWFLVHCQHIVSYRRLFSFHKSDIISPQFSFYSSSCRALHHITCVCLPNKKIIIHADKASKKGDFSEISFC